MGVWKKYVIYSGMCYVAATLGYEVSYYPFNGKDRPDSTVILTGATGRIGRQTAYDIARKQSRLIMACRDMHECKRLRRQIVLRTGNKKIACRRLNLEDIQSINEFADDIIKNEPKVDALINAAGVKNLPDRDVSTYGFEKHFWVNFVGPYLLTSRLIGKLQESAKETRDSRIINIVGRPNKNWLKSFELEDINFETRKYKPGTAYEQSRLAVALYTMKLHELYSQSDVYSYAIKSPLDVEATPFFKRMLLRIRNVLFESGACIDSGPISFCAIGQHEKGHPDSGGLITAMETTWGRHKGWDKSFKEAKIEMDIIWNLGADVLLNVPECQEQSHRFLTNHWSSYITKKDSKVNDSSSP